MMSPNVLFNESCIAYHFGKNICKTWIRITSRQSHRFSCPCHICRHRMTIAPHFLHTRLTIIHQIVSNVQVQRVGIPIFGQIQTKAVRTHRRRYAIREFPQDVCFCWMRLQRMCQIEQHLTFVGVHAKFPPVIASVNRTNNFIETDTEWRVCVLSGEEETKRSSEQARQRIRASERKEERKKERGKRKKERKEEEETMSSVLLKNNSLATLRNEVVVQSNVFSIVQRFRSHFVYQSFIFEYLKLDIRRIWIRLLLQKCYLSANDFWFWCEKRWVTMFRFLSNFVGACGMSRLDILAVFVETDLVTSTGLFSDHFYRHSTIGLSFLLAVCDVSSIVPVAPIRPLSLCDARENRDYPISMRSLVPLINL